METLASSVGSSSPPSRAHPNLSGGQTIWGVSHPGGKSRTQGASHAPRGQATQGEPYPGEPYPGGKLSGGTLSGGQAIRGASHPLGKPFLGQAILGASHPGASYPGIKQSRDKLSGKHHSKNYPCLRYEGKTGEARNLVISKDTLMNNHNNAELSTRPLH